MGEWLKILYDTILFNYARFDDSEVLPLARVVNGVVPFKYCAGCSIDEGINLQQQKVVRVM